MQTDGAASRNVAVIYLYTFLINLSRSMWSDSVLSAFIFMLTSHRAAAIGAVTGVRGCALIVFSPIGGWLGEKRHRRSVVMRCTCCFGVVGVVIAVYSIARPTMVALGAAMALNGGYWGLAAPSVDSLLAESVGFGTRSRAFTRKNQLRMLGSATAPLVSCVLFLLHGDVWTVSACQGILLIGVCLSLPPIALLLLLRDADEGCSYRQVSVLPTSEPTVASYGATAGCAAAVLKPEAGTGVTGTETRYRYLLQSETGTETGSGSPLTAVTEVTEVSSNPNHAVPVPDSMGQLHRHPHRDHAARREHHPKPHPSP